jgi:hypothetical protein
VNDLNTARQRLAGAGIQTAALGFGGKTTPTTTTAATEEFSETGGNKSITSS